MHWGNKPFANGHADVGGSAKRKSHVLDEEAKAQPHSAIWSARRALPMAQARNRFLEEVQKHPSCVLVGETGSGKTTQVPQFLHELRLDSLGNVAVTQPRRVAAITLAQRVAAEMTVECGSLVGYRVRFEDCTSDASKIIFLTDGMLLREAMIDRTLSRYAWIILDEAHERTVNTDVLFGVVKAAQAARSSSDRPLRIIVMSATLDADRFSRYLRHAPVLVVKGRQHAIQVRHSAQHHDDWQNATLATVFQIHKEAPERHDILVFLTGQDEIESMTKQIRQMSNEFSGPKIFCYGLFAAQAAAIQQKVFLPTKVGCRKIILSTNIAETSLTIPGVRYVVDSCRVKAKVHQASTGLDMLKVVQISQAQGWQRAGRAGREGEGHCYRILTKGEFDGLAKESLPEILTCNLGTVLLQMLSIGIKDVEKFDFLDRPPPDAIAGAQRLLKCLGAIDANNALTEIGRRMAAFPLEPRFTKAIFAAKELGCTEEIITIVSMLSSERVMLTPPEKREAVLAARKKFFASEGDHITLLNLYRAFNASGSPLQWCQENFVQFRHMKFACDIRKQLLELCRKNNIAVQSAGGQTDPVRKALAMGLFTNVARLTRDGHYVTLDSRQKVRIHPTSVMFHTKPELVIFTELIATQKTYIRDLTLVDAKWLTDAHPDYFRQHHLNISL